MLAFVLFTLAHFASANLCATKLRLPFPARHRLIEAFKNWNQLTPQQPGEVMIVAALTAEILRDFRATFGVPLLLSEDDIDGIGETINRTHIAFKIPVRYSRSELHAELPLKIIGPARVRAVFEHFYQSATGQILYGLMSLHEEFHGGSHRRVWKEIESKAHHGPGAMVPILNREVERHGSLNHSPEVLALLDEALHLLDKILDSEEFLQEAKHYRQSFAHARIDPGFASLIETRIRDQSSRKLAILLSGFNIDF